MALRTLRERVFQTLMFEAGGLLLVTPLYVVLFGATAGEGILLLVSLSIAVMSWAILFNSAFDWVEWQRLGRLASARPHRLRFVHAILLEVSSLIVTLPLVMSLTGAALGEALVIEFGLTAVYAVYAYVFHLVFDRFLPVRPADLSADGPSFR